MLGWAPGSELDAGASVADLTLRRFEAYLGLGDSLREALDTVITSHTRVAPVFDGDRYIGMLTTDEIGKEISQ